MLRNWPQMASSDPKMIRAWWGQWPEAEVGILTGNGLTVIDMDVKHPPTDGVQTVLDWQMSNGFFPQTRKAQTLNGGQHLYFRTENYPFKCKNNFLPGVDIKGIGGYVVAPPSINGSYKWLNDFPIAEANENVLAFLLGKNIKGKKMSETQEGNRNNTMLTQTYKLAHDFPDDREGAKAIALEMNLKCVPPLDEEIIVSMLDRAYSKLDEEKTAGVINLADIEPEEVEWLWYPYIPRGKLTIIAGEAGVGKTFVEISLAAIVSKGLCFPGEEVNNSPGIVCIQNTEDGLADTIVKRLIAAGADLNNVKTINDETKPLTFSDPRIEDFMQKMHPDLMIFDPFQSFFGAGIDLHRANETRPVFDKLLKLAQKYGTAIVIVMHLSKMTTAGFLTRVLGSVDVVGSVRSVLGVVNHPTEEGVKVFCHEKGNLAPKGESIKYQIVNGAVQWGDFCTLSADDCLSAKRKKTKNKFQMAVDLIETRLKTCGKVSVTELKEIVVGEMGTSYKTLQRAKNSLGLIEEKDGFAGDVFWKLP